MLKRLAIPLAALAMVLTIAFAGITTTLAWAPGPLASPSGPWATATFAHPPSEPVSVKAVTKDVAGQGPTLTLPPTDTK